MTYGHSVDFIGHFQDVDCYNCRWGDLTEEDAQIVTNVSISPSFLKVFHALYFAEVHLLILSQLL